MRIGIDVGGTKIEGVLLNEHGNGSWAQALGAPGKIKKCRITTEVTTNFFILPGAHES